MSCRMITQFMFFLLLVAPGVAAAAAPSPAFTGTFPVFTVGAPPGGSFIGGIQFDLALPAGVTVTSVVNYSDTGSMIAFNQQASSTTATVAILNINSGLSSVFTAVQCSGAFSGMVLTDFTINNIQVYDTSGNKLSPTVSLTSSYNPDGDLNGDSQTQAVDALLALRLSVGLDPLTANAMIHGDMNGDGKISAVDALLILRKAVGL